MSKDKSDGDTISEETFTSQTQSLSTSPEDDSPGDSETDAGNEFLMGLGYEPSDESETDDHDQRSSRGRSVSERSSQLKKGTQPIKEIPESAEVTSSEQPSPWLDRDAESSIH